MSQQLTTQTYDSLREEVEAALTEMRFTSNTLQVEWKHSIGEIIRRHAQDQNITALLTKLAVDVGTSDRSLWRCVEIYDLAPEEGGAQKLIEAHGKDITVTKLLAKPEDENHEHIWEEVTYLVCECGSKRKK